MAVLSDQDVESKLSGLEGWGREGDAIERQFQFGDKVGVTLSTHSEGGLTEKDFELAAKIDGAA